MDIAVLLSGIFLSACSVIALAISNRSKDRTIERLVLMGKAKSAREYGYAKAIEGVKAKAVALPAPAENGPMMVEREPLPDSETAALFNRPG